MKARNRQDAGLNARLFQFVTIFFKHGRELLPPKRLGDLKKGWIPRKPTRTQSAQRIPSKP